MEHKNKEKLDWIIASNSKRSGSGSCTGRYSGNLGSHVVRGRNEP